MKNNIKILIFLAFITALIMSSCATKKKVVGHYEFKYHPGIGIINIFKNKTFEYVIIGDLCADTFYGNWNKKFNIIKFKITSHDIEYKKYKEKTKYEIKYLNNKSESFKKIIVLHQEEPYPLLIANINDSITLEPDSSGTYYIDKCMDIKKIRFSNCVGIKNCIEFRVKEKDSNKITINIISDFYNSMVPFVPRKTIWFYKKGTITRFDILKEKHLKQTEHNNGS